MIVKNMALFAKLIRVNFKFLLSVKFKEKRFFLIFINCNINVVNILRNLNYSSI